MGFGRVVQNTMVTLLLVAADGALGLLHQATAVASKPVLRIETPQNQIAQAQRPSMTWRSFVPFIHANGDDFQIAMLPQSFPNGFANGQVALTAMHTGYSSYVVAREGVQLPNLSTVRRQIGQTNSFNTLGPGTNFDSLPALSTFPSNQYSGSNVIEVVHWAARYDDEGVRAIARQSRQQILPDGRRAYYMAQVGDFNARLGWCTFADERAQYSEISA